MLFTRAHPIDAAYCCRRPTLSGLSVSVPACVVAKLLSKRWWIPIGARHEGPKLKPEGQRAEVGFPTAERGFSSIRGTMFGLYGI